MSRSEILDQLNKGWEPDDGFDPPTPEILELATELFLESEKQGIVFDQVVPNTDGGVVFTKKYPKHNIVFEGIIWDNGDIELIEFVDDKLTFREKFHG